MDSPKPLLRLQARQHITALGEEVPSALNKLSASLRQSPAKKRLFPATSPTTPKRRPESIPPSRPTKVYLPSRSHNKQTDNPSDDILSQAGWSDIEALPDDAFNDEIADGPLTNIPLTDTETPPETEK
ncbi:uncharacterized protein LOC119742922 isoform X1 [Patiria miniata]|uniref:Uncharacterized protein n=1 Tax=Patiria miniata TaxID=46514 RepID=A0A914BG93_PATMI|nr:uncharacterized protein LOC119742922 isoform X1 [Patiria miniata]